MYGIYHSMGTQLFINPQNFILKLNLLCSACTLVCTRQLKGRGSLKVKKWIFALIYYQNTRKKKKKAFPASWFKSFIKIKISTLWKCWGVGLSFTPFLLSYVMERLFKPKLSILASKGVEYSLKKRNVSSAELQVVLSLFKLLKMLDR